MPERVFITGMGIISALGNNVGSNFEALNTKRTGIRPLDILPTRHRSDFVAGEIKSTNEELNTIAEFRSLSNISRTTLLGTIAVMEAIQQAALSNDQLRSAAFVNGTTVGGMDISELYFKQYLNGEQLDYKEAFAAHDCGDSTERIADRFNIKGYVSTISTACSSSANTIMHAAKLIKTKQVDVAIAGGTDALSVFTLNGFNTLKILDHEWCKPFDKGRKGLNLGEGAAYLVLESESQVKKRNAKVYGELIGYGNANDAYHQTASSPEGKGAYMAMQKAMETANITPAKIDYINAHGTGTDNNDQSESISIKTLFEDRVPPYSSTKAYTGHTLGAAGGLEAVFSLLSMQHGVIYPNLNINDPMDVLSVAPQTEVTHKDQISCVLSNSFGFGGNCSSLIFAN